MNEQSVSIYRQFAPVTKPFEPIDEQEYSVTYEEGGQTRFLIGTIEFPDAGGVVVRRTRATPSVAIYLPYYVKIEERPSGGPARVSGRFQ